MPEISFARSGSGFAALVFLAGFALALLGWFANAIEEHSGDGLFPWAIVLCVAGITLFVLFRDSG